MKKILITIITFCFGIGTVLIWITYKSTEVPKINQPILLPEDCIRTSNFPGLSQEIANLKKGNSGYFPAKTFYDSSRKDHLIGGEPFDVYVDKFYGKHLKASQEKSLLDVSDKELEVYRFNWLRTFSHPIFIRIEKQIDKIGLVFKELDGQGGYEPGKIIAEKRFSVTEEEWCKFKNLLNEADYWQMPTLIDHSGLDGESWILEGFKENHYKIVYRWSPEKDKYREVGIFMLKIAGYDLDKNKDDLY